MLAARLPSSHTNVTSSYIQIVLTSTQSYRNPRQTIRQSKKKMVASEAQTSLVAPMSPEAMGWQRVGPCIFFVGQPCVVALFWADTQVRPYEHVRVARRQDHGAAGDRTRVP